MVLLRKINKKLMPMNYRSSIIIYRVSENIPKAVWMLLLILKSLFDKPMALESRDSGL